MWFLISTSYNKKLNAVRLTFYNSETGKLRYWFDSDFKAYCLAKPDTSPRILFKNVRNTETVTKYDALHDEQKELMKINFMTPLDVKQTQNQEGFWENHVRFHLSYIYDKDLKMGMPYQFTNGGLEFQKIPEAETRAKEILKLFDEKTRPKVERFASLFEYPAPNFKRIALDAEMLNKNYKTIPNPQSANLPIICICFHTSEGEKIAYVLNQGKDVKEMPKVDRMIIFNDEAKLLKATFDLITQYPFIITFNGDEFDLPFFKNRAIRLGIPEEEIPITVTKHGTIVRGSIHIDLYKFFNIKAIRIYAFKGKYKRTTLDAVGKALLKHGKTLKTEEKNFQEMAYKELIDYCMNDTIVTYDLTSFNNHLVMNLILALCRISRLPIGEVSRKSVSFWIKSLLYYEHRRLGYLIPTKEEILALKGKAASKAMIKGKKYKGGAVFKPKGGSHWKVLVADFASLYPSVIKVYNIGYATINCLHPECKHNTIGELPHWICTKHEALESILIGGLRDLRVRCYKKWARDEKVSESLRNWYSVVEQSSKVIMNASYGVLGSDKFVLYCPPAAEEIAGISRYAILKTAEKAVELGLNVLYGDTDSIFIKNPPSDKMKELIEWTEKEFGIDFEIDTEYRYVCLSERKKNYLGVKPNGKVDVKGMTGKKRHTPKIFKNAFETTKTVLGNVQKPEELEKAKEDIKSLVKHVYQVLKQRKWENLSDLAFTVGLNKPLDKYVKTTPQHVKAARMLIADGRTVEAGAIIEFVKVNTKAGVKPLELAKREDVNVTKYVEFLKSTFEQILDPLEISFNEDIVGLKALDRWLK